MELLRLKDIMAQKGVSGKELAKSVGVTPVSISNIVQGNSFPKPELLLAIADRLDVDVRELFNPTKKGSVGNLNGFVEHNGEIHRITSLEDLRVLMDRVEG
ncbi:helix-turn-helix domain-containing protein [Maribacter flavus]|uniref:Helix-turn-helix transcriptional regulator n=1 Tax=Maribacter flavus TaxID=1658664 RepID=A0A5B2TVK5_9FLAO|nr:helix-turn-helix transcriptional regulator [Maribacter flavus]KAA2218536.1 helix-turn-helix transcriptional regulator [Maribacter flavus]